MDKRSGTVQVIEELGQIIVRQREEILKLQRAEADAYEEIRVLMAERDTAQKQLAVLERGPYKTLDEADGTES